MMLSEVAKIVSGKLVGRDLPVTAVSIDTRTLIPGQLYLAIKGRNFDGNSFVDVAERAGAVAAIVHEGVSATVPHVIVSDTRLALAELAGAWRKRFPTTVVGITGSNGKTTVKEMIASILSVNGNTLYTQGNLNNDIGVPLTLLRLNEHYRYAVIEMGANHPGEIAYSCHYVDPDAAVITNVGPAHIEGFGSVDGVAKAKGEIVEGLRTDAVAVLNRDDRYFDYWCSIAGDRKIQAFGMDARATVRATAIETGIVDGAFSTLFELITEQSVLTIKMKLAGHHNVMNALAAAAVCLAVGVDTQAIKQGLEAVMPVTGRLQPLIGRLGNVVIDDTYNANSASLKAALDVLNQCPGKHWLVLGAFGELGSESAEIHKQIGEQIRLSGVKRLLAVGADARYTAEAFGMGADFYSSQDDLIKTLDKELTGSETILVKGSRSQRMEKVVATLVENFRA